MPFIGAKSWVFHPRTRGRRVIFSMLVEQRNKQSSYKSTTWLDDFKTGEYSDVCTFEAATSCAVLAAISCEQAMSSSYVPFSPTTRSAESLTTTEKNKIILWFDIQDELMMHSMCLYWYLQQLCGAPAHSFGGGDESFGPTRVFGIKFCNSRRPLQEEQTLNT